MQSRQPKRIAVIGAGISGIAAANVLQKLGHDVVVFEKSDKIGGVWAMAYPEVRLQNTWEQYSLSDFPWPFEPDRHPTAAQILRYFQAAIDDLNIPVRLQHTVTSVREVQNGWQVQVEHNGSTQDGFFDYVIVAVGQYTGDKNRPTFPGEAAFPGDIMTERDINDLSVFDGKTVAVVGFGKSALDMATLAASRGAQVHHVFRQPRWTLPRHILGIHYTLPLFSRFGSVMMTSWAHPTAAERFLHKNMRGLVNSFWKGLTGVIRYQINREAKGNGPDAKQRLQTVVPDHDFLFDLRSAVALAPDDYYKYVAEGKIQPHHAQLTGFSESGLCLEDSEAVSADVAVLSLGAQSPAFPFLPQPYREMVESEPDGTQLYRHLIHPRIPNLGFAGFNHGFMHIPAAEVGTLWLAALMDGELDLPSVEQMEAIIEEVRQWKRDHIAFEPSRSCAVNTRYQQYIDILLKDLGVSPYRKGVNVLAEVFQPYGAKDYAGVIADYDKQRGSETTAQTTHQPLALPT